jgi:hypothetical protein
LQKKRQNVLEFSKRNLTDKQKRLVLLKLKQPRNLGLKRKSANNKS